jgi:hypothetical protein
MPDQPPKPLKRRDIERIAHEALGRQLRLMVGMSALLLVLGFVVGQFTGASLARRNTERLQAHLDQVQRKLATLEQQIADGRDAHAELEAAFIRVEQRRRSEIEIDRAALEVMIGNVEAAGTAARADLDAYNAERRTVPADQVRGLVDRFVSEQAHSLQRLLASTTRRLEISEPTKPAAPPASTPQPAPAPPVEPLTDEKHSANATNNASPSQITEGDGPSAEATVVEADRINTDPPACRPRDPAFAEARATSTTTVREQPYLTPPRRRGYLFFSPTQPRRMDPARVSESETVPLPPR